jgi:hypothetical protein
VATRAGAEQAPLSTEPQTGDGGQAEGEVEDDGGAASRARRVYNRYMAQIWDDPSDAVNVLLCGIGMSHRSDVSSDDESSSKGDRGQLEAAAAEAAEAERGGDGGGGG